MGQRIVMTPAKRAAVDQALEENLERREELTRRISASDDVGMKPELWKAFQEQTKKDEKTGCLLWTGPGFGEDGFGLDKATKLLAHRAAYQHYTGRKIPKGYIVEQSCSNKRCCEESHLAEVYVGRV